MTRHDDVANLGAPPAPTTSGTTAGAIGPTSSPSAGLIAGYFAAPAGQFWVRRSARGKWHLVRTSGGEFRCRLTGSPKPWPWLEDTLSRGFGGGSADLWRPLICRHCLALAGYDPDTGQHWAFLERTEAQA